MAEFKFSCPGCGQGVICDELWSGHAIQVPSCQAEITVPPKPAAAPAPTGPVAVPTGGSRLSINQTYHATQGPKSTPIVRTRVAAAPKKKSPLIQGAIGLGVVIALAAGGYYGYNWWEQRQKAKEEEEAKAAAPPPPPAETKPPPPKELPLLPAVWTLDVATAQIPEGKANGKIAGTNFVVETARVDRVPPATHVLGLRQGAGFSPDREVLIYLHLNPGDVPTNHTWTITKDMRGAGVPPIRKRWKTDPRYAPQTENFSSGYAMKLELGQMTDNVIDGKIFLALPDKDESVVAGLFKATLAAPADASGQTPVAAPPPPMARDPRFEKRYGIAPPGRP